MRLVIGGNGAGKYDYLLSCGYSRADFGAGADAKIIYKLNALIRKKLDEGGDPAELFDLLAERGDVVIVADEVGCGVIPVSAKDRVYVEATGRLLCRVAGAADVVERVYCGIAQRIKG